MHTAHTAMATHCPLSIVSICECSNIDSMLNYLNSSRLETRHLCWWSSVEEWQFDHAKLCRLGRLEQECRHINEATDTSLHSCLCCCCSAWNLTVWLCWILMLHVPPIGQGLGKGPVIEWLKQMSFRMSRNQSRPSHSTATLELP